MFRNVEIKSRRQTAFQDSQKYPSHNFCLVVCLPPAKFARFSERNFKSHDFQKN